MNRMLSHLAALACALLFGAQAYAQGTVQQVGPVTPGDAVVWSRNGQVSDGGATAVASTGSYNWTGKQTFGPSTTTSSAINIVPGAAPIVPINGDIWATSTGLYAAINNVAINLATPNLAASGPGGVSGILPVASGGSGTASASANTIFAAPNGSSGAPSFRALVATDIPNSIAATNSNYTAAGTGGATETVQAALARNAYADQWGADNTCVNDASAAISNAFAGTSGAVHLSGCYRASATIVIPTGRILVGDTPSFANPVSSTSTRIVCDLGVSPCVQVGSGGSNGSTSLRNLTVTRASGTPGASTIGVQVLDGQTNTLENVQSVSHGICYQALAHPSSGLGITLNGNGVYSGACVTTHFDISSYPEVRISHARFGQNGSGDYNATSYVRIEGGVGGTASGPNTIAFTSSQFNQGANSVSYFMEFINLGSGGAPSIDATDFRVSDSHIEAVSVADFYSDSSWNVIDRVAISNNGFNTPSAKLFSLNAATSISEWSLVGNQFYVTDATLAPTGNIDQFYWAGGKISGATSFTGTSGSTASIMGVSHGGNVTYAGTWGQLSSVGELFTSGSMNALSATGNINILSPNSRSVLGTGAPPTISACGTSPTIDGRSSDTVGAFTTGTGTVTSCTVTYAQAFPNMAWPVVSAYNPTGIVAYVSSASKTGFTLTFAASNPGESYAYHVVGK